MARHLRSDGNGGWRVDEQAATEIEKLTPEAISQLWPLLKDPQVEVRRGTAVYLLTQFDPAISDQVVAFSALLGDNDRTVRGMALNAVKQFRPADQIAVLPQLTAMLNPAREDRAENRVAIARLCGTLKAEAAATLQPLEVSSASDPDSKVRATAYSSIAQIANPPTAVPILARGLADQDASVRLVAAARMRQLGPAAAVVAKELAAVLGDADSSVAETAAEALIRIGQPAIEPLAGQLASKSTSARKLALACLAKIGPPAKPVTAQIDKCRQDADPQVRQLAETALKRISGQ
jgi:HEAT repeat protein